MKSTADLKCEILCVSQFTLYHELKGNKPDFRYAMGTDESKLMYHQFLDHLKSIYEPNLVKGTTFITASWERPITNVWQIADGVFGAYMQVSIENDGPVTLQLESPSSVRESEIQANPLPVD